ncbi:MAG TPA: BsuBI/PstI family type II restriction endonuclease [Pirellulales bacterium]|nr:BsuBI/PstI family type II restriction endonuclease [Pirellulales bacterium]
MAKRDEAKVILVSLGLPAKQQGERSCLTLLALAALREETPWAETQSPLLRIVDIMSWMRENYRRDYAPNTRETVRRQTIHQFEDARLVDRNPDQPGRPTNSGKNVYRLTPDAARVLRSFGGKRFGSTCAEFLRKHGSLAAAYTGNRQLQKVAVKLADGTTVDLSPGRHNELQRAIIQDFAPRFAPGSRLVYLGDTAKKHVVVDEASLETLDIPINLHDKLPDIVLLDATKNWLFLIEAVTSHGPVSPKRHRELEKLLADCNCGRIYVTAFLDFSRFRKYAGDIVWESEVWIAESPDHMIHYDGQQFLGPYGKTD